MALIDLASVEIEPNVLKLLPRDSAVKYLVMPLRRSGKF
jgi:hypothetical protein